MAQRFIGLDIGHQHIRAVVLERAKDAVRCVQCAEISNYDDLGQRKTIQRTLTELDGQISLKGTISVASSDLVSMVRFEHNDPMPPERLERVLRMELQQHANAESGDLAADAVAIPLGGNELIHCCGLVQPAQVNDLLEDLKAVKIQAANVDLAMAAGANAIAVSDLDGELWEDFGLVIDIGSRVTRLMLMRGPDFLACRQLTFGGDQFTEALARLRDLKFEEAEHLKCSGKAGQNPVMEALAGKAAAPVQNPAIPATPPPQPVQEEDLLFIEDGFLESDSPQPIVRPPSDELEFDEPSRLVESPAVESPAVEDPLAESSATESSIADGKRSDSASVQDGANDGSDPQAEYSDLFGDSSHERQAVGDDPNQPENSGPGVPLGTDVVSLADGDPKPTDSDSSDHRRDANGSESDAAEDQEAYAWQRQDSGFILDEPEIEEPGQRTVTIGGQLGPEMRPVAEQLHGQIAKSLVWFVSQLRMRKIDLKWVRLSGAGSELAGLEDYLERRLKAPVAKLDPFHELVIAQPPMAPQTFTLAVGLARSAMPGAVQFALLPESVQRKQLFWDQIVWPRIGAGLLAVATVALAIGLQRVESNTEDRVNHYEQHQQQHQRLTTSFSAAVQQRDGLLADLKSVASRILGGRDVLYGIRALKQEAPRELWLTSMTTTAAAPGQAYAIEGGSSQSNFANVQPSRPVNRGVGGRGGRAVGPRPVDPDREEARSDTLITSVRITGFIKPGAGQENIDQLSIFDKWYNELLQWRQNDDELTLFTEHDIVEFPVAQSVGDSEQYRFDMVLYLRPTSWQEVAERVQGQAAQE